MIKQNCALHMHVYADFMHFAHFVNFSCMNRHFGNMYSHLVDVGSRFTVQGSSQFRMIFRTPVHDSNCWVEWFSCVMS